MVSARSCWRFCGLVFYSTIMVPAPGAILVLVGVLPKAPAWSLSGLPGARTILVPVRSSSLELLELLWPGVQLLHPGSCWAPSRSSSLEPSRSRNYPGPRRSSRGVWGGVGGSSCSSEDRRRRDRTGVSVLPVRLDPPAVGGVGRGRHLAAGTPGFDLGGGESMCGRQKWDREPRGLQGRGPAADPRTLPGHRPQPGPACPCPSRWPSPQAPARRTSV